MRILVISDLHYELEPHHGVDESGAFAWLAKTVEWAKPSNLVGLGDWGHAWTKPQWDELTSHCHISAIYGNHDKLELLRRVKNSDGSRVLAHDSEIREIAGLRFGFINGIVSETKRSKQGIPRKAPESYVKAGSGLTNIDVLCTHESPYLQTYGSRIHESPGTRAIAEVIREAKPRLALSGHIAGPFSLGTFGNTTCLRIDSSPAEKHYAVLETESNTLEIYNDRKVIKEIPAAF